MIICGLTYVLLNNIMMQGIFNHSRYLGMKKFILITMTVNLSLYFSCLLIISYYQPIIAIEKLFTSILVVLKEINSIMFILNYVFFVFTLKYDLQHIQMHLEVRPDMEYFVFPEEDFTKFFYKIDLNFEDAIRIIQNLEMGRQNLRRINKPLKLAQKKVENEIGGDKKIMMEDERTKLVMEHLVSGQKVKKTREEELKFFF